MPQNTPILTVAREWDHLEPAMDPGYARRDHVKVPVAGAGATVAYAIGQILRQKDDGTNEFAKQGTAGYTGPARLNDYPFVINENGLWQLGDTWNTGAFASNLSIPVYFQGFFKTQDVVGLGADDTVMNAISVLIRGTRTAGIIKLK